MAGRGPERKPPPMLLPVGLLALLRALDLVVAPFVDSASAAAAVPFVAVEAAVPFLGGAAAPLVAAGACAVGAAAAWAPMRFWSARAEMTLWGEMLRRAASSSPCASAGRPNAR